MSESRGQTVGPWTLHEQLGHGGNGTVWKATRPGAETPVALKVLTITKIEHESYKRFVREIGFLRQHQGRLGLLPLLDSHLPDQPSKSDRPWLAMPVATPIAQSLAGRSLHDVVEAVATIANTLASLQADFDIAHRDIKPGNLYELDGSWLIGDFGLIALPDAETLTHDGRQVGPAHYTASSCRRVLAREDTVGPGDRPGMAARGTPAGGHTRLRDRGLPAPSTIRSARPRS